jgi:LPXTG-motif cell wall-anchored protein
MVTDSEGNQVNLNEAEVRVITDAGGMQSLQWSFPERLLPAYRKSFWFDYYFEMLPIRLIYQVKLTDDALQEAVRGTGATFYVGGWEDRIPNVRFSPSNDNPYFSNSANLAHTIDKADNFTETLQQSFTLRGSAAAVTIEFGNNGRIRTDNFVDNALPDTGGIGVLVFVFAGFMVILAGAFIFTRHHLKNTKKILGGN